MFKPGQFRALSLTFLLLTACGGGGGSDGPSVTLASGGVPSIAFDGVPCPPTGSTVTISGIVSYERVPFSAVLGSGLDYNNIQTLPIRGAVIEALGNNSCIISSTITSNTGSYSLSVDQNIAVKIRVKAKTQNQSGAIWDFEVRDNTTNNNLYVLDGSSVNSEATDSIRNLTATSGWTGSSYGEIRGAAPFAILDSIYESVQGVVSVDPNVAMNDADIFWSVNNSTALKLLPNGSIDTSSGEIGSSFYSNNQIYLLGKADSDTDEYDEHIVVHEWGHYLEDNLSRSDSIGGAHSLTNRLDMRVALSEGFSNAFSGIITGDPVYRDSLGAQQSSDFQFSVEANASVNIGWFNESSVQTILYDIYDSNADANDGVNLGFSAIYNAMTSTSYSGQSALTSIFSLVDQIKNNHGGSAAAINTLTNSQSIDNVADAYGSGETNDGGNADNLPVYKSLTDNGAAVNVCSNTVNGEFNRLGNRQFIRLTVTSGGNHDILAIRTSGLSPSDPDIVIHLDGVRNTFQSGVNNQEFINDYNLNVDEYIIEVYEFTNTDESVGTGGSVCFDVSVSSS